MSTVVCRFSSCPCVQLARSLKLSRWVILTMARSLRTVHLVRNVTRDHIQALEYAALVVLVLVPAPGLVALLKKRAPAVTAGRRGPCPEPDRTITEDTAI